LLRKWKSSADKKCEIRINSQRGNCIYFIAGTFIGTLRVFASLQVVITYNKYMDFFQTLFSILYLKKREALTMLSATRESLCGGSN